MTSCVGTEEVNFSDIVVGRVARSPRSDMFLRQIRCLSAFDRIEGKEEFAFFIIANWCFKVTPLRGCTDFRDQRDQFNMVLSIQEARIRENRIPRSQVQPLRLV